MKTSTLILILATSIFCASCSGLKSCADADHDGDFCGSFAKGMDCHSVERSCDEQYYYEEANHLGELICSCDTILMEAEIQALP